MLRAPALAIAALALAGCLGPGPRVTMEVVEYALLPLPGENQTLVRATVRLSVAGSEFRDAGVTFWVQDAAREVLLVAHQERLNLTPGKPAGLTFSVRANGLGFPVKLLAVGEQLQAEAWPPAANNTHPFATRLATGNDTWAFLGTHATDRQLLHFVVDNTGVATPPQGPVMGTLSVRMGTQERLLKAVDLAPGAYAEGTVLVRDGERLDVAWSGDAADVLVYVGDEVFAQYRAAAGR